MKVPAYLSLMMVLISCNKDTPQPQSVELFKNTSVEEGGASPSNWWLNTNGTGATFLWASTEASTGTHSLKISSSATLSSTAYWGQSVSNNIPVGKNLTLTLKVKGASLDGGGAAVAIACLNATSSTKAQQFSTTQGSQSMTGTFDWTTYTIKLSSVRSDITEIRVYLMLLTGATGEVFFDDIELSAQ